MDIRYRGIVVGTANHYVYGFYLKKNNQTYIQSEYSQNLYEVYPNSVSRLVAYDKNNQEVYEGDSIISDTGEHSKIYSTVYVHPKRLDVTDTLLEYEVVKNKI